MENRTALDATARPSFVKGSVGFGYAYGEIGKMR
jgi:hypothetical protein